MIDILPLYQAMAALRQNIADMQANLGRLEVYVQDVEKSLRAEDDDEPDLLYIVLASGLEIYHVLHDDCISPNWYTVDPDNNDLDFDNGSGTQFDIRDIASAAHPVQLEGHPALLNYAVQQGWLTEEGLKLPNLT
ncbi:MAG: hypothetical protein DPW09_33345 [Anaerolineae bacterium]|nr:hypothetical protein [Anaerolineales bacterium]MCQ3978338.1 hypothetical protein [Anaerolineae bacterium]